MLRLLLIFLVASSCTYFTVNQPMLRLFYQAVADYWGFLTNLADFWRDTNSYITSAYHHSILALSLALGLAILIGTPLGLLAGTRPNTRLSLLIRLFGSLGLTTPSFLLALFIMIFFVLYVLPATGIRFILISSQAAELDLRRLLPIALTLAARPLAHFVTVTAAAANNAVASDYIRTARSKGLSGRNVLLHHVWPNVLPDLLRAVPVSLLFTLSSLPIVEFVFNWPGMGQQILFGIIAPPRPGVSKAALVTFLLTSLGITYFITVAAIDYLHWRLYPFLRHQNE